MIFFQVLECDFGFGMCRGQEFGSAAVRTAHRKRGYDANIFVPRGKTQVPKKVCSVAVSIPAAPLNVGHFERVADISLPSQRLITQQ